MTHTQELETGKMTNIEFARRVGCHHTTASRYRNGERVPSTAITMRILSEFDLTPKQKDELSSVLSKAVPLERRRALYGAWLRANVFNQPATP
jgi:transcriptional regulator with XRE-family HTH domain